MGEVGPTVHISMLGHYKLPESNALRFDGKFFPIIDHENRVDQNVGLSLLLRNSTFEVKIS